MSDSPVLVGVDGSDSAARAVDWAAAEAARRHLPLLLTHTIELGAASYVASTVEWDLAFDHAKSIGIAALDAACARIDELYPGLAVSTAQNAGDPAAELLALSRDAALTVIGAGHLNTVGTVLVGSIATTLLRRSPHAVGVIRGSDPADDQPAPRPVVAALARNHPCTEAILGWAFEEAALRGTGVIAVSVSTIYPTADSRAYATTCGIDWRAIEDERRRWLDDRLAPWRARYPEIRANSVVDSGHPIASLLIHASAAQLVVVGTSHRHGDVSAVWGRSVSRAVTVHAACSVLVARTETADLRDRTDDSRSVLSYR